MKREVHGAIIGAGPSATVAQVIRRVRQRTGVTVSVASVQRVRGDFMRKIRAVIVQCGGVEKAVKLVALLKETDERAAEILAA